MSSYDDEFDDLPPSERAELEHLATRLVRERPVPQPAFRGELRRRMGRGGARRQIRLQALAYLTASAILFGVATLGVFDVGPLSPQPLDDRAATAHLSAAR